MATVRPTRTRPHVSLALLLAGCPAYPVLDEVADAGTASSSTGDDAPTGAIPTGTDSDTPGPTTTGEASTTTTSGSTGGVDLCGDGIVDPGEDCDDGPDNDPYAACTDLCQLNVCGDGKVHAGVEACDEGAANVDDGYCRSDCQLGVTPGDAAALAEWKAKKQWLSFANAGCGQSYRIYCIEAS